MQDYTGFLRRLFTAHAALFLPCFIGFLSWYFLTHEYGAGLVDHYGLPFGRDFIVFWTAIQLMAQDNLAALYNAPQFAEALAGHFSARELFLYWGYPPPYLLLLWPFTFFSYHAAHALWLAGGVAAWVAANWRAPWAKGRYGWILAAAPVGMFCLFIGQNGLYLAAALVGGLRLLQRQPLAGGALLSLITLKPHLAVLIPFYLLASRQWRALLSFILCSIALYGASILVFGWQLWPAFFHQLLGVQSQVMELAPTMMSLFTSLTVLGAGKMLALGAQALLALSVIFITCRFAPRALTPEQSVPLLAFGTALCTPYLFHYDIVATGAAIVMLIPTVKSRWQVVALIGAWYWPCLVRSVALYLPISPLWLLLGWLMALHTLRRE